MEYTHKQIYFVGVISMALCLAEIVWLNQISARQFKSIISVAEIQSGKHDFMNVNSPPNAPVSVDIAVQTNYNKSHVYIIKTRQDKYFHQIIF